MTGTKSIHTHFVKFVGALPGGKIFVGFEDGKDVTYDVSSLANRYKWYSELLADESLFEKVAPSPGGYSVLFGDEYDISSDELYQNGQVVS